MKIKINNKIHKIKPASELTVKEYIEIFDKLEDKANHLEVLIIYLSVTLNLKYGHIADININEVSIKRLLAYIGQIPQAKDIPVSKEFYYKKTGKIIYQDSLNWRSIGVRKLLEDRKEENQLKFAVYLLAVYLSANYDNEKIEKIYQKLQDYNAVDVFGFVIFFFKKLHNGKSSGKGSFRMLLRNLRTNTVKPLNK